MKLAFPISLAAGVWFGLIGSAGGAAGQDKNKAPDPLKEEFLGKTVGEWIKILRTHEKPNYRRAALIALDGSTAARNVGRMAVFEAIEKDKDAQVRMDAVALVGNIGPELKGAIKVLVGALQTDKADAVREAAAQAIATKFAEHKQVDDYADALVQALKDPHEGTRIAVAGALRNMGEKAKQAVPAMFVAAENPKEHPLIRAAAIHLLVRQAKDDSKTVPLLIAVLKDRNNPAALRDVAADGLSRSGSDAPEAVAALCQALTDKNLDLRKTAAASLGKLGAKAKSGWPAVQGRLSEQAESDSGVRNHLIRLAGAFAKTMDEPIPVLTEIAVGERGKQTIEPSTENRIAAIQELAELGARAKSAVPALRGIASQDPRAAVRAAADKAVARISAP